MNRTTVHCSNQMIKYSGSSGKNITYTKNDEEKHKMGDDIGTGTNQTLLNSYMQQLQEMPLHQFNKVWQLKQFKSAINSLTVGHSPYCA